MIVNPDVTQRGYSAWFAILRAGWSVGLGTIGSVVLVLAEDVSDSLPVWVSETADSPPGTNDSVVKLQKLFRAKELEVVLGHERRRPTARRPTRQALTRNFTPLLLKPEVRPVGRGTVGVCRGGARAGLAQDPGFNEIGHSCVSDGPFRAHWIVCRVPIGRSLPHLQHLQHLQHADARRCRVF